MINQEISNFSATVSPKRVENEAYKEFLPPILYGMSDVLILVLDPKDDLRSYLEGWLKSCMKKVRNCLRPALIIILNHKKKGFY